MCCFSKKVKSVSRTQIFARFSKPRRQVLVYSMAVAAPQDLAMILPIPTPYNSPEKSVKFISLKGYADFFKDMEEGFPTRARELEKGRLRGGGMGGGGFLNTLEVQQVGNFEASFVPTIADFNRLDERFQLPSGTWEKLPAYRDYGFAVFKLKKETKLLHPIAFDFPSRHLHDLFFPTVHIHDGEVHEKAKFDHILYCQRDPVAPPLLDWRESPEVAYKFIKRQRAGGIIHSIQHVYRKEMKGMLKNEDVLV